jgi:hypothetical protein
MAYVDVRNLLGDNKDNIKKSTETSIDASKEVGLETNEEKTKCMLLSPHQIERKNCNIKTAEHL